MTHGKCLSECQRWPEDDENSIVYIYIYISLKNNVSDSQMTTVLSTVYKSWLKSKKECNMESTPEIRHSDVTYS